MWYNRHEDLAELRRKANANLVKCFDGTHKRQLEQEREFARQRRENERAERRERRENILRINRELKETRRVLYKHEQDWKWLYDKHTADKLDDPGDFGVADIVVLEEVDAMRNNLCEKIVRLEDELWMTERL